MNSSRRHSIGVAGISCGATIMLVACIMGIGHEVDTLVMKAQLVGKMLNKLRHSL